MVSQAAAISSAASIGIRLIMDNCHVADLMDAITHIHPAGMEHLHRHRGAGPRQTGYDHDRRTAGDAADQLSQKRHALDAPRIRNLRLNFNCVSYFRVRGEGGHLANSAAGTYTTPPPVDCRVAPQRRDRVAVRDLSSTGFRRPARSHPKLHPEGVRVGQ